MVTGQEQTISEVKNSPPYVIPQRYLEAGPYTATLRERPNTLEKRFKWATHLIQEVNISKKFNDFVQRESFSVSGEILTRSCMDEFAFCRKIYKTVLFPKGSPQLSYHNLDHALVTSITAQKIFLGALADARKGEAFPLSSPDQIQKLHKLITVVSAFHEIDDWWNLPYPDQTGTNPHIEQAKNEIKARLTQLGLSTHDFNRFLVLDDFREAQDVCLNKGLTLARDQGFIPENNVDSILDALTADQKKLVMTAASNAISASDFLQVINPAYLQPVDLEVNNSLIYRGFAGPYVLAQEMSQWRKKALEMAQFGRSDGTIYWDKVGITLGFFEGMVLPRINSGIKYLDIAAPEEYSRAREVLDGLHNSLKHITPNQTTSKVQ